MIERQNIRIGIITAPPQYAQDIAEAMIASGVLGIWNFSSGKINVPDNIIVEDVDLSISLSVLTTKLNSIEN